MTPICHAFPNLRHNFTVTTFWKESADSGTYLASPKASFTAKPAPLVGGNFD